MKGNYEFMNTLLLNRDHIENLVSMKEVVQIVERTYREYGEGKVVNPAKVTLDLGEMNPWPPYGGFVNAMPAYVGWVDTAGIKWVSGFADNHKYGLPFIGGMILLINPRNGQFTCVAEGGLITTLRTGAQTAVALKYLLPDRGISLGLYGAGAQGKAFIDAASECLTISSLKVYDPNPENAQTLKKEYSPKIAGEIRLVDNPEEAAQADAVISFTPAKDPFILNSWVKPGTILFPLGSYQECDDTFIRRVDHIVVDHEAQSLHRGPLKTLADRGEITEKNITATLGEIISGKKKAPDTANGDRVLCAIIGIGALDVAVASTAYQKALEQGVGREYSFT